MTLSELHSCLCGEFNLGEFFYLLEVLLIVVVDMTVFSSLICVSCWAATTVILCVELDQNEP